MMHVSVVVAGTLLFGAAAVAQTPQTPPATQQKPQTAQQQPQSAQQMGQKVTLTGCLRQTSDDPKLFALVDAKPGQQAGAQANPGQATGTSGTAARSPFYRLQDPGTPSLKPHVGKRVEVVGTVTPAKDEKGADIVTVTKEQTISATATTIRALALKPAPLLNVTSVKATTGECPSGQPKK